ncbi:MAG: hypothetical protein HRU82_02565 [Nitrospira sp.]|nr:MAG: hypothetical protein HRU82_02565 [Nitrospira sp.]
MSVVATDPVPGVNPELQAFADKRAKRAEEQGKVPGSEHQSKETAAEPAGKAAQGEAEKKTEETKGEKEKSPEQLKKELSDQTKANLKLGRNVAELKRQNDQLRKQMQDISDKLDGKDPDKKTDEDKAKEAWEAFKQRSADSEAEAIEEYGDEFVRKTAYEETGPYKQIASRKPWLANRVLSAEKPVHEVLAIVAEEEVLTEFGRTKEAVLEKAKEILRPILFKEFQTEVSGKEKKKAAAPTLSHVKPAGDEKTDSTPQSFSVAGMFKHNSV